jgi:hypothetical protein
MLEEPEKYILLTDLGCCAVLKVKGFNLVSTDRTDPKRIKFIFKGQPGIVEAIKAYNDNQLDVKAQEYWNAIKILKNVIYSEN